MRLGPITLLTESLLSVLIRSGLSYRSPGPKMVTDICAGTKEV